MANSWKLTARGDKATIQAALLAQEEAEDWDAEIVLSGFEIAPGRPGDWRLDTYFPRRPSRADRASVALLFAGKAPRLTAEKLPDEDWLARSQEGLEPIRAGRFRVRAPDQPPPGYSGVVDLVIPVGQAFGTGQHATTAGCLAMLDAMKRRGAIVRNFADIGTGTGLLAFAALALWPRALATASDIDPVCLEVIEANSALNRVRLGAGPGALMVTVADGLAAPVLEARGPYDLLIANILAGPLVELAPDFASAVVPGGNLLLAGLLEVQEPVVRRAYARSGFRLAARLVDGDWSILWLRRRARF